MEHCRPALRTSGLGLPTVGPAPSSSPDSPGLPYGAGFLPSPKPSRLMPQAAYTMAEGPDLDLMPPPLPGRLGPLPPNACGIAEPPGLWVPKLKPCVMPPVVSALGLLPDQAGSPLKLPQQQVVPQILPVPGPGGCLPRLAFAVGPSPGEAEEALQQELRERLQQLRELKHWMVQHQAVLNAPLTSGSPSAMTSITAAPCSTASFNDGSVVVESKINNLRGMIARLQSELQSGGLHMESEMIEGTLRPGGSFPAQLDSPLDDDQNLQERVPLFIRILNLDFAWLTADRQMLWAFHDAMVSAIARESGGGHVEVAIRSNGIVAAMITPPSGVQADELRCKLMSSCLSLWERLAASMARVEGISAASKGPLVVVDGRIDPVVWLAAGDIPWHLQCAAGEGRTCAFPEAGPPAPESDAWTSPFESRFRPRALHDTVDAHAARLMPPGQPCTSVPCGGACMAHAPYAVEASSLPPLYKDALQAACLPVPYAAFRPGLNGVYQGPQAFPGQAAPAMLPVRAI